LTAFDRDFDGGAANKQVPLEINESTEIPDPE